MRSSKLFTKFFESKKAGGLILVAVTIISIFLANSVWQKEYIEFWHQSVGSHSVVDWINDGLMAIFFLLILFSLLFQFLSHSVLID